jgi:hypothetical protein
MEIQKAVINFDYKGKPRTFTFYHNLEEFGLDIGSAFISWTARAKKITESSFCHYVRSKDRNIVCVNEEEFKLYYNT